MQRKESLAERAHSALKQDIISCKLPPGEPINEGELAATYGMSKTPIREALNLLRNEGFVQILPRRGTLVKPIDIQDVQHTFLLRMLLEPEAAALAASRATGEQLKRITSLSKSQGRQDGGAHGQVERLRRNRAFHVAIAEASGVPRIAAIIGSLHEEVERFYNSESVRARAAGEPTEARHHDLVHAIVTGDVEQARTEMSESIKVSRQHLIALLIDEAHPLVMRAVGAAS